MQTKDSSLAAANKACMSDIERTVLSTDSCLKQNFLMI